MKARIAFDFCNTFFYKNNVWEDIDNCADVIEVDWEEVKEFNKGDEVEVLKVVEDNRFSGGKGYVIYNPTNAASTVVAYHVLKFQ